MLNILVTGGHGFVGRAIVAALMQSGARVAVLSRRAADIPDVETLVAPDGDALAAVLAGRNFDLAIHAAAPGVKPGERAWHTLINGCCGYTVSLVEALAQCGTRRVVYLGSWSEYAAPVSGAPIAETQPLESRHGYGAAKAAGYLMGLAAAEAAGIEFVSARLFNVFGPGEAKTRLLPHVISRLHRGEAVDLTPGLQERDFIYVGDAADAVARLALHKAPLDHPVYNVCSGIRTSVRALVLETARQMQADERLLQFGARAYRADEPQTIVGDPERLATALGWRASTGLAEGTRRLIDHTLAEFQTRV